MAILLLFVIFVFLCGRKLRVANLERQRLEEERERMNRELKTRAIQLEEINRELESFSHSVSHDLRAPLRHIQGYAEMLSSSLEGQLSEKPARYLSTINAAAAEMGQLIDDLLAFSRMGRAELRQDAFSMDQLLEETIRGLELHTGDRQIQWRLQPLPAVTADRSLTRQVLSNLLQNALKYSRTRENSIVEAGTAGEENACPIFFVRDNGVGFDMRYAHKLFGVFQRLHRADEFEGSGIGLATVRRIVSRHGGRVWAESCLGQGATFYFTLPPADQPSS